MKYNLLTLTCCVASSAIVNAADVKISVDTKSGVHKYSPYLFGRNTSDIPFQPGKTLDPKAESLLKESGIKFVRLNNGNNATKYNYQKHLTCHPDWYSNIYDCDWDMSSKVMNESFPGIQAMYSFQLCGYVASTKEHNFNDWEFNKSQWGEWCSWPLCGGGEVIDLDKKEYKAGDPSLYLEEWTPEQTTDILTYWKDDLKRDMSQFIYWNMDNEPEMWSWTHKDVQPDFDPEFYIQQYVKAALAAKKKFPEIKLCGPVAGSEWTWFKTSSPTNSTPTLDGEKMPWLKYFIVRIAQEQKKHGVKLLDVLDIHYYPSGEKSEEVNLQSHRTYFDRTYDNPEANGLYTLNGGWDTNIKKEYILGRCDDWMKEYMGEDHGVTFSVSEYNISSSFEPITHAIAYISHVGELMKNNGEFFTPWSWYPGMWEAIHLMARYSKEYYVPSQSSDVNMVESYVTVNENNTEATLLIVNRSTKDAADVEVTVSGMEIADGSCKTLSLSDLPATETFVSHTENALVEGDATISNGVVKTSLPAKSVKAVLLRSVNAGMESIAAKEDAIVYPTVSDGQFFAKCADGIQSVDIIGANGIHNESVVGNGNDFVAFDITGKGSYIIRVNSKDNSTIAKVVVK